MGNKIQSIPYPEHTTAEIVGLTGMVKGEQVFDTDIGFYKEYNGAAWVLKYADFKTNLTEGSVPLINASRELIEANSSGFGGYINGTLGASDGDKMYVIAS